MTQEVSLGTLNGQDESMIHKNTDDLSDLKCILNNYEHGVKKKEVSLLWRESKLRQCYDVLEAAQCTEKNDTQFKTRHSFDCLLWIPFFFLNETVYFNLNLRYFKIYSIF